MVFPVRVIINDEIYRIAGSDFTDELQWDSQPVPAQLGEFQRERAVTLGDGAAGITGSHRHTGGQSSPDGVADVTDGDTSFPNRYGAGPAVTTIDLSTGNSAYHAAGSIGGSLTIGGSGAPSLGGPASSGTPTAIWSDGDDDNGERTRTIYVVAGGRLKSVDPTTDTVVETYEYPEVDGGDFAYWGGHSWVAFRGAAGDVVRRLDRSQGGSNATVLVDTDYTATVLHAGPDALYRGYQISTNKALLKKTTQVLPSLVESDSQWTPDTGEQMGDPGIPITRFATLGERLVVGKEDGLYEFDSDFTARRYLEWMAAFRWKYQCNFILPLGQAGDVIVSFRRGLYLLPANRTIGVETLSHNDTDKKGRYTAGAYDGRWIYAFLESTATDDTHLIKMDARRTEGPGLLTHHPIATLTDKQVLAAYVWPGGTIGGTTYGPRLYFGNGSDGLAYIRLGETLPDQQDSNYRFTTGAWSIQWPEDDFGSPNTLKSPLRVGAEYENVTGTAGITWSVSDDGGTTFTDLDATGSGGGAEAVQQNGFRQRFGPRDGGILGRTLIYRVSGTGSSATAQQAIDGQPVAYIIEQPEMVQQIQAILELKEAENPNPPTLQLANLYDLSGGQIVPITYSTTTGEEEQGYGRVVGAERVLTKAGVIGARVTLRMVDYDDE